MFRGNYEFALVTKINQSYFWRIWVTLRKIRLLQSNILYDNFCLPWFFAYFRRSFNFLAFFLSLLSITFTELIAILRWFCFRRILKLNRHIYNHNIISKIMLLAWSWESFFFNNINFSVLMVSLRSDYFCDMFLT